MLRRTLIYGAVAGVIAALPLFVFAGVVRDHPAPSWAMIVGYLTMLVALSVVFVAVKRRRDEDLGGVIRFWPAFAFGLAISLVAGVLYVGAWELALAATHLDFAGTYAAAEIARTRASGADAATIARVSAEMEQFRVQYAQPLYRLPMTFAEIAPVGLLVSLVTAGVLSNRHFLPARRAPGA